MQIHIYHTVNSGLFLFYRGCGLLIDGLYEGETVGMSPFSQQLRDQLESRQGLFARLNAVLFTHLHPDHYSAPLLSRLQAANPQTAVFRPEAGAARRSAQYSVGPFLIHSFPTVHDGKEYVSTPHDAYLVEAGGERILLPGDAGFSEGADYFCECCPDGADVVFVNPYQMLSAKLRALLRRWQPDRLILTHLPWPEDDTYQYRALADRLMRHWPQDVPTPKKMEPFSWLDGNAPDGLTLP